MCVTYFREHVDAKKDATPIQLDKFICLESVGREKFNEAKILLTELLGSPLVGKEHFGVST